MAFNVVTFFVLLSLYCVLYNCSLCGLVVDPVTFEEFYKCWKENEVHIHRATPKFKTFKCVLKISDLVKCSLGMGHILLTKNRYYYGFVLLWFLWLQWWKGNNVGL